MAVTRLGLTEDGVHRLERLRASLNVKSNSEVITTAVGLLEWFLDHQKAGDRVYVVDPADETRRLVEVQVSE